MRHFFPSSFFLHFRWKAHIFNGSNPHCDQCFSNSCWIPRTVVWKCNWSLVLTVRELTFVAMEFFVLCRYNVFCFLFYPFTICAKWNASLCLFLCFNRNESNPMYYMYVNLIYEKIYKLKLCAFWRLAFPDAIYLVDAIQSGETVIKAYKPTLESNNITKVIHDCKRDSEVSHWICLLLHHGMYGMFESMLLLFYIYFFL